MHYTSSSQIDEWNSRDWVEYPLANPHPTTNCNTHTLSPTCFGLWLTFFPYNLQCDVTQWPPQITSNLYLTMPFYSWTAQIGLTCLSTTSPHSPTQILSRHPFHFVACSRHAHVIPLQRSKYFKCSPLSINNLELSLQCQRLNIANVSEITVLSYT